MSAHNGEIVTDTTRPGYYALCGCGWESDERPTFAEVAKELAAHQTKAKGTP